MNTNDPYEYISHYQQRDPSEELLQAEQRRHDMELLIKWYENSKHAKELSQEKDWDS
jgi:hypothetical protein